MEGGTSPGTLLIKNDVRELGNWFSTEVTTLCSAPDFKNPT